MAESFDDYNKRIARSYEQPEPTGTQKAMNIMGGILAALDQEDANKRKKQKDETDMYNTLREAGYDPKAAYEAAKTGNRPPTPPSETLKEKKDKADLAKSQAQTSLAQAQTRKADAEATGNLKTESYDRLKARILNKLANGEQLTAGEREIYEDVIKKKDPFADLMSGGAQPSMAPPVAVAPTGKIRVRRKADGKTGIIDAKDFRADKYERA